MTETNSWVEQVKKVITDRAFSLNYEEGLQCRFMPIASAEGSHTIEIYFDMTHSGHPFDLTWLIRFTEDPSAGADFELRTPPGEGGTLWHERHISLDRLRNDAQGISAFIRGYFAGRAAVPVTAPQTGDQSQ